MVVFCPHTSRGLEVAQGSDYEISGATANPFKLLVTRTLLYPGTGLTRGSDAHFFVANYQTTGAAIKPLVGCVSTSRSARRSVQPSRATIEIRQQRLTPSSHSVHVERCPAGERVTDAVPGVLLHARRPPTRREISQVDETTRMIGGRALFVVRIGPDVSDNTRVTLQMTAVCRR